MFEDKKGSEKIRMHGEKDHEVVIKDTQTVTIGEAFTGQNGPASRNWTLKQGDDYLEVKQGNLGIDVDMGNYKLDVKQGNLGVDVDMGNYKLDVKMGDISVKADLGKIEVEAMQSITLKVGQSSVTLDQMGVTIKGMMISVEGQIQTQVKAVMTQVSGDAMLQLSGGIIMIG
jgi:type VI secretion system secreted protein VgrG